MAAKKKSAKVCKFGKVTRGVRKGHCRKARKAKK